MVAAFLVIAFQLTAAGSSWQSIPLPFTLVTSEGAKKPLPATMPGGIAVFDADGDNLLDIFLPNGAALPSGRKTLPLHSNRLFRNLGGFRFADWTAKSGVAGTGYDFAAAAGDYDNDGQVDLLVCGLRSLTLYRNLGNGSFTDVTASSRLDNRNRWSVGAAWVDVDNDADLDLFVVNYVRWNPATEPPCVVDGKPDFCHPRFYEPEASALFRNNGDGTFTDISEASGIAAHKGKGMAAAVADFDGNGFTDIFVTNDRVFNFLFRNLGGAKFQEDAFNWNVAVPASGNPPSSMGADAQDYDNDGRPDLIYTALRDETFPLYRNLGNEFEETTLSTKLALLTRPMAGWGIALADLDNDGWKDIAVARSDALSATGPRGASAREPLSWFRNGSGTEFLSASLLSPVPDMYRGLVAADFNNDGCLDIVVTALNASARILRNPCPPANWLKVEVAAPNARVRAGSQWRASHTAAGYASSCACPLHFGLGAAGAIDLEVLIPNRPPRRLTQVRANQTIKVEP
jgi:hypothetical protein